MKRTIFLTLFLLMILSVVWIVTPQPAPAGDGPVLEYDFVVVRAFFDDLQMVTDLAGEKDLWQIDYHKNYFVTDVTAAEYQALEQAGFRLEIDETLTMELNQPRPPFLEQGGGIPGYSCYRTVEETLATAQDIVNMYPQLATIVDIGDSWEKDAGLGGYDLIVLRLTNDAIQIPKPKLFSMSSIHAREYTPAELNTRFAEYLVHNYGTDPDATWLLDYHEIHLLLQANPDGRKHAESGQLWRKNTNQNYCSPTSSSRGADLNRNFEFEWGCCGGSSSSQCSETYRGASAASEPESQAVQDYIVAEFPDQRDGPITAGAPITTTGVFLDIHSYSQLVLWPWGFTSQGTGNDTSIVTLGRKLAYFNGYTPQQAIDLYITDGTTLDFAYGELGLAAYTYELGTTFFQACSTFENTILPDNLPSLLYAAKSARTPYLTGAGPDALNVTAVPAAVEAGTTVTLTATLDDTRFNNSNGTEPVQNIAAAAYYIDVPPWITSTTPIPMPMSPADGTFNSSVEGAVATIDTTGLSEGRHIIFVQGQDANGSWGVFSAAFLYVIDPVVAPVIGGQVTAIDTGLPLTATVMAGELFQTTTEGATGQYEMQVISGTYDLTVVPGNPAYAPAQAEDVVAHNYQTVQQNFFLYPYCDVWADDVESGNIGWTAQAPWAITTESAHSPTHSWTDSPGGNYGNNVNVSLTSPVFDLTDYNQMVLNFWHICSTEAGYDYCYVEVSTNGGTSWNTVASYDGLSSQWQEVTLSLSDLDNQANARIRFRLDSDGFVTADGWHVDDIRLYGTGPACIPYTAPQAGFASTSPDALGTPTQFTNDSTGTDLSFQWDFGDNSPVVTDTAPAYTYGAVGLYTVTLTATNDLGSDAATGVVEILAVLEAAFTSTSPDALGTPTQFSNDSTGTDLTFQWDFGDNSPIVTDTAPAHTYGAVGLYTVTLTATNNLGSDVATGVVEILAVPEAAFTSTSPDALGTPTQFSNKSTGTDLTFQWDFGDGSPIATTAAPTHTYALTGTYTVVLTATNEVGSHTATGVVQILAAPQAGFVSSSPHVVGLTTIFTSTSTGSDLSFQWDFGDGSPVSTDIHPTHTYTMAAVYTVTLTITNDVGSDAFSDTVMVIEVEEPEPTWQIFLPLLRRES